MATQPEAIRLADAIENSLQVGGSSSDAMGLTDWSQKQCDLAAAELRRLSAVNAELLAALRLMLRGTQADCGCISMPSNEAVLAAFAAIALATPAPSTQPATMEVDGALYREQPITGPLNVCTGCAFEERDGGCEPAWTRAAEAFGENCGTRHVIYVKAE